MIFNFGMISANCILRIELGEDKYRPAILLCKMVGAATLAEKAVKVFTTIQNNCRGQFAMSTAHKIT